MDLTIDDYIDTTYTIRTTIEDLKKDLVEKVHRQVTESIKFSLPLIHVDSYNVQSIIVPLENKGKKYFNIIDHSMVNFFEDFLLALEYNQPNLVVATYKELRRHACVANNDLEGADFYQLTKVYYTEYEIDREDDSMALGVELSERFEIMLRFHFLHEYTHYLLDESMRSYDKETDMLDVIVEALLNDMEKKRVENSFFSDEHNQILNEKKVELLRYYKRAYANDRNFKSELICDFQSILYLLELSGSIAPRLLLESAITYLYVQYALTAAKGFDGSSDKGGILHLRMNIMFKLADFLNDEKIATAMAASIHRNNQAVDIETTFCEMIDYRKFHRFYNALSKCILEDKIERKRYSDDDVANISPLDDIIVM